MVPGWGVSIGIEEELEEEESDEEEILNNFVAYVGITEFIDEEEITDSESEGEEEDADFVKSYREYRDKAKTLSRKLIGNGEQSSFWFDSWSDMGCLWEVLGPRDLINMGISRLKTVAEAWCTHRRRLHRSDIYNTVEEVLHKAWQEISNERDTFLWKGKSDEYKNVFNTKETWINTRISSPHVPWHQGVWFAHSTPKFSFCVWLAMLNRLQTGDRRMAWAITTSPLCVLCNDNIESRDHLFFFIAGSLIVMEAA